MSEGLNRWMGLGNLAADPELRVTPNGQSVLRLRLACSESYKDRDGNWAERAEWVTVSVWGKRGESLSKHLAKGSRVFVEGSLRTSSYEKNGEKKYSTEIVASKVLFAGGRNDPPVSG